MINDRESMKIRRVGAGTPPPEAGEAAVEAADLANAVQGATPPTGVVRGASATKPSALPAPGRRTDSGRRPGKRRAGKAGRIVLIAAAVLLLAGLGYGIKFYYDIMHPAALFQPGVPNSFVQASVSSGTAQGTVKGSNGDALLSEAELSFMKNRVNILVLGLDKSTAREDWGSFRTDTIILVTVDFSTGNVDMISIPRDSYVKLVNASGSVMKSGNDAIFSKINSAFPTGGGSKKNGYICAMNTVSYLLGGIPVNYYLGFDMNVVQDVVTAMGGLDYDVDTEVNLDGVVLHPGKQHLNGNQVLQYARQRKGSSDIARVERQQKLLAAIFGQLKQTGKILRLPQIYAAVQKNIETSLSTEQIASLALLASHMSTDQLGRHMVDGNFLDLASGSYWGVDTGKLKSLVKEVFGVDVKIDSDISVSKAKARIEADTQAGTQAGQPASDEFSAARAVASKANGILKNYSDWLTDSARSQLTDALAALNDALDSRDPDQVEACAAPLEKLCATILEQLKSYGKTLPPSGTASPEATPPPAETPGATATPGAATPAPLATVAVPEITPAG